MPKAPGGRGWRLRLDTALGPGEEVDLGAAPGGWTQVAVARTNSTDADPMVVALDILPMDPMPGATVLLKDMLAEDAPDAIRADPAVQRAYLGATP